MWKIFNKVIFWSALNIGSSLNEVLNEEISILLIYKERMKTENKFSGGKMTFGYDKDENGFFVPIEKEQEVIREMLLMRKQGKSYRDISSEISKSTRKSFLYLGHIK